MSSKPNSRSNLVNPKWVSLLAVVLSVSGAVTSLAIIAAGLAVAPDTNTFSLGLVGLVFSVSCLAICYTLWRDQREMERIDAMFAAHRPQWEAPAPERPKEVPRKQSEPKAEAVRNGVALDTLDFIARRSLLEPDEDDKVFDVEFYDLVEHVSFRTTQFGKNATSIVRFWNDYSSGFPGFKYRIVAATPHKEDPK